MNRTMLIPILLALTACKGDKNSGKSPYFNDDDILTISGQFLGQDNQGLASTSIA